MLPYELLRVRRSRGEAAPLYADNEKHGELCKTLIEVVQAHVGSKKGWLESKLAELEGKAADFKLVRGLSLLLLRRCVFRIRENLAVEPKTARRVVFEQASLPPLTAEERAEVLVQAASKLGVDARELEEALWADRDSELVLVSFTRPDPSTLIAEYNLELTRTLVSRASRLRVYTPREWKKAFLYAKKCGLMYHAEREPEGLALVVEGTHHVRGSNSYAEGLVGFFDSLLNLSDWKLEADVPSRNANYTYVFKIDSNTCLRLGFGFSGEARVQPSFDSEVERRFYYAFRALNTGWTIEREAEPLLAGDEVFIPDFTLTKDGLKLFVEIVGFWTKDYLERKIRKLSSLRGVDIVVLADKSHSLTKLSTIPGIIFFEGDVPLKPILDVLALKAPPQRVEAETDEADFGATVEVSELKKRYGDDYKLKVEDLLRRGYVTLGSTLVEKGFFDRVAAEIGALDQVTYEAADRVCSKHGLKTQEVLEALGFKVKWLGLDSSKIVVEPQTRAPST